MTKQQMIRDIMEKAKVSKEVADKVYVLMFYYMICALEKGEEVRIEDFGKFHLVPRKPKKYLDFNTGETKISEPFKDVVFKPWRKLIDLVKDQLL